MDYFFLGELYGSLHYVANKDSGTKLKFIGCFCSFLLDSLSERKNSLEVIYLLSVGVCGYQMVC